MIQASTAQRSTASSADFDPDSGLSDGQVDAVRMSIAQLTDVEIDRMEENDLVNVIEMADIRPVDRTLFRSLEFRKIGDLKRIVLATRTACRDYWLRAKKIAEAKADRQRRGCEQEGEATMRIVLPS
jgi:hypothetical protein